MPPPGVSSGSARAGRSSLTGSRFSHGRACHASRPYHVAISIDGFIAPKDGSADWLNPYGQVAMGFIGPWMKQIGGIIVGRATYDQATGMGGWMWKDMPALVMTSRSLPTKHPNSLETASDPGDGLKSLRARMPKGDIWLFGGSVTAGLFLKENLIDLIELAVVPVALGEGRPLFSGVALQQTFEHTSAQPIGLGCVVNSYKKIEAKPASPKRRPRSR
jgi:dihydrofolate reductase